MFHRFIPTELAFIRERERKRESERDEEREWRTSRERERERELGGRKEEGRRNVPDRAWIWPAASFLKPRQFK